MQRSFNLNCESSGSDIKKTDDTVYKIKTNFNGKVNLRNAESCIIKNILSRINRFDNSGKKCYTVK